MSVILRYVLTFISALAFCLPLKNIQNLNMKELIYLPNVIEMALVAVLLIIINRKKQSLDRSKKILSVIFGIFVIIGECYVNEGTFLFITSSIYNIVITIIKLVGYSYLFMSLLKLLDYFISKLKYKEVKPKSKISKFIIDKLERYPFRFSLVVIMICWSIYLIAFYPIILNPDSSFQIMQFFNVKTKYIDWVIQRNPNVNMTTHHPVIQTMMLGLSILIGRKLGSDNLGLFIYSLVQVLFMASVFSYSIKVLSKNKVSNKWQIILLLIYSLVPMFPFYAMTAVKDTIYTGLIMLFILFVYDFIKNYKDKKANNSYFVILCLIMFLASIFRNNGIYVMIFTLPFMLAYSKPNFKKLLITSICFLVLTNSYNKILIPALGISDGSIREALSIPFQQTARLAKYDDKIITKKDKKTIDKVLGYKTLAERYNPELADPVKNEYNKFTTNDELKAYFKVWLKYLKKEPLIYIDATLNNTYGYIYPNAHKWYLYSRYDSRIVYGYNKRGNEGPTGPYKLVFDKPLVKYHFNSLKGLREILAAYGNIFPYIPILGLMCSIGFGTWIVLILTVYLRHHRKYLITLIPLYTTILVCFASPANTYFRYAMPYLFTLPFIIMLILNDYLLEKKNEINKRNK